jgi:predicted membrane protein
MVIKFEIKFRDLLFFNIMSMIRFPAGLIILFFFAVNIVTSYNEYAARGIAFFIIHQVIFLAGFVIIILLLSFILILIRFVTGGLKSVLCEHEMEFRDEAFTEKTQFNESRYMWHIVPKCVVMKKYFFIYVSSSIAHIIPKRYLSETEINGIHQLLRNRGLAD